MRHIPSSVVLEVLLLPALALGETVKFEDLAQPEGLYYKKLTDVLFTGRTTGKVQGHLGTGKKMVLGSVTRITVG